MPAPLHPTRTYDRAQGPSQVISLVVPPPPPTPVSFTATLFSAPSSFPSSGCVAYYKLEDLTDATGGTSLTNHGSSTFGAGQVNNAVTFVSASNQWLSHADQTAYHFGTGDFSFAFWVKSSSANSFMQCIDYGGRANFSSFFVEMSTYFFGTITDSSGNTLSITESVGSYNNGVWHLYICTVQRSGNYKVIIDNVVKTNASAAALTGSMNSSVGLGLGADEAGANKADITLDEVGLWNRALDSTETAALWNGGAGTTYSTGGGAAATLSKLPKKALTATLTAATAQIKKIIDGGFAATLNRTGALTKKITRGAFTATQSFVGLLTKFKFASRAFTATLNFVGTFAKTFIAGGGTVFQQALTATLSFTGAISKIPKKILAATLSFTGAATRKTLHFLTGTLWSGTGGGTFTGATWASNGSASNIQTLHDSSASDGDTITIPAGTFTWTTTVTISKAIRLQGAGIGVTIIRDSASPSNLLIWNLVANKPSRMTGIEFTNDGSPTRGSPYIIELRGGVANTDARSMRVDHCKFDHLLGLSIAPIDILGVIDNNTFLFTPNQIPLYVYHGNWNNQGPFAGGSWNDASYFGSSKFLFVENNTFTNDGTAYAAMDGYKGARVVFRYNTLASCFVEIHGTDSAGIYRGGRAYEIYNNTFTGSPAYLAGCRSAVVRIHDNTGVNGLNINLLVDRSFYPFGQWGTADGTNVWDVNDTTDYTGNGIGGGTSGKKASGTAASGGVDAGYFNWPTVTVSGTPWTANAFAGFCIKKTSTNSADQKAAYIHGNTNNTITYSPAQGFGTNMTFSASDTFEIYRVLQAMDQPGRSQGSLIAQTDPSSPPSGWNDQVTEPCYEWNNGTCHFNSAYPEIIRVNEHFFNSTTAPGYAPYTYPHPLTVLSWAELTKRTSKLLAATTSFAGTFVKTFIAGGQLFTKSLTATLSFVGAMTAKIIATRAFTATLSFTGALTKRAGKAFTATLNESATLVKRIIDGGFSATLSFVGALTRRTTHAFAAALSFIGNLATFFIHGGTQFTQSLTASLSFIGAMSAKIIATRAFTATLNATTTLQRSTVKAFIATLTALASLAKRISRPLTATLSAIGVLGKAIRDAGFTATLSFAGAIATLVAHFFVRAFTASLSFVGALSRTRVITRVFTATLGFAGAIRRSTAKVFAPTLSFTTALRRGIRKGLVATLSFIGFLFRGGFIFFSAGIKTESNPKIQVTSSSAKIQQTESNLKVERTD